MKTKDRVFLGADIGGTRTRILITSEQGEVLGFGETGPGNHETVGWDGLTAALQTAGSAALASAGLGPEEIAGAGFGVAGYDWPSEMQPTLRAIETLGLTCPLEVVNDTILGLVSGSPDGWGVAVVSGTGCNCWGWDATRRRIGRVTGGGIYMGEGAGGTELIHRAVHRVAHAWTQRGQPTLLTDLFVERTGALDAADLLEGLMSDRYQLGASAAPLVFQAAERGDEVAAGLLTWAGDELGEMVNAVVRQLNFEDMAFHVVMTGSMFDGGERLTEPMRRRVTAVAPGAQFTRLSAPPVLGAALIGMAAAGLTDTAVVRQTLVEQLAGLTVNGVRA